MSPQIPNNFLYSTFIAIGWISFAVHIISIGMSTLPTQIYTVLLLGIATVLNVSKVGCDDSNLWRKLSSWGRLKGPVLDPILVSSRLQATFSEYNEEHCFWEADGTATGEHLVQVGGPDDRKWWPFGRRMWGRQDLERQAKKPRKIPERRQDLFSWLELDEEEEETMKAWNLFPRKEQWWDMYLDKKREHQQRVSLKEKGIPVVKSTSLAS
jgi:hypothetical protein